MEAVWIPQVRLRRKTNGTMKAGDSCNHQLFFEICYPRHKDSDAAAQFGIGPHHLVDTRHFFNLHLAWTKLRPMELSRWQLCQQEPCSRVAFSPEAFVDVAEG